MGPHKRVMWSSDALSDLESLWTYYLQAAGPDTAEKIVREIYEVTDVLAEHPQAGRMRNEIRHGLRSLATAPHVIFYRIKNDIPEIIRILDGRQDIEEIFSER
jgi:toxin ParE1/3/4